jgi:hypothetical protein
MSSTVLLILPIPDLQTFLSLPHLISKATYEEKNVEKLGSEGKLNRKSIIFTARIDEIIWLNSNVISDVLFSISLTLFFTSPNCKVTSSTVLFILLINVSCN